MYKFDDEMRVLKELFFGGDKKKAVLQIRTAFD
ncbi:hypothetical protein BH10BAC5_BH10BAC5_06430 [soil metagenome]